MKKVAILTNGGDAPGLNAVIRAIVKTAETNGIECYGYIEGYKGLLENNYVRLDPAGNASGILDKGGTIIGTSNNTNVFNYKVVKEDGTVEYQDLSDKCVENVRNAGFDCVFTLGGDGTQKSSRDFCLKGVNCIGVPKTIDNDVAHTSKTFGFNTAVSVAVEALDRLHTTATSHHRVLTLEVMGRYAGWIALESAIAGGADVALLPEIPYDINKVAEKINQRNAIGKKFSIVVVSEGAKPIGGELSVKKVLDDGAGLDNIRLGGAGELVADQIEKLTGMTTRNTVLGYVQRGGTPTAYDRILSTKYGVKAMELAMQGIFKVLVTYNGGEMGYIDLDEVVGRDAEVGAASSKNRPVPLDHELLNVARELGICLGD